jgi:hypothetical protein
MSASANIIPFGHNKSTWALTLASLFANEKQRLLRTPVCLPTRRRIKAASCSQHMFWIRIVVDRSSREPGGPQQHDPGSTSPRSELSALVVVVAQVGGE